MKKVIYIITITLLCILCFPWMIFGQESWNRFGRSVDKFFGIKSRHTIEYEREHGV